MIEPKSFYRDFDELLLQIRHQKSDKNFLFSILETVQKNVADRVHLGSMKLYEEWSNEFVLTMMFENSHAREVSEDIMLNPDAAELVLKHGSYIFDDDSSPLVQELRQQANNAVSAAIAIRGREQRWIAVFELKLGWVREEVIFSLNAIRTAINYRMFSDRIHTDLEQAAQIQQSLLPQELPQFKGYDIAARTQPTEVVGGDLYDFYQFDEEVFGLCIGDASGHGLPAALLVRDVVIGLRMGLEKHMKMVHTLQKLNHVIYRSTYSSRFVSLFYGEIELNGHLIYVNAGHPTPFIVKGDEVQDLKATGLILGALPEIHMHRSYAHMDTGSVLVLYSDGLFERENRDEELFNINRMKQLVIENQEKGARELVDLVYQTVYDFGNRTKWEDDSTLVIVKRLTSE